MVGRDVGVEVGATTTGVGVLVAATSAAVGDGDGALVDGEMAGADVGTGLDATANVGVATVAVVDAIVALVGGALVAFVAACGVAHAPMADAMRSAAISRRMFRD